MKTHIPKLFLLILIIAISVQLSFTQKTQNITPVELFYDNPTTVKTVKFSPSGATPAEQQASIKAYETKTNININADDPYVVKAWCYNYSGKPILLVAKFTFDNDVKEITYPIAFIEKNAGMTPVMIYGPLFYDGRAGMRLSLEMLVFKEKEFNALKSKYNGFFKEGLELIPALGQASKFVDLGWKVAEQYYGKDIKESFTGMNINRQDNPELRLYQKWYLLANKDAQRSIGAQPQNGITVGGELQDPILNMTKGRAILVSVLKSNRASDFASMSARINNFLDINARNDQVDVTKFKDPFQGESVQSNLAMNSIVESYLSRLEIDKSAKDTQTPVIKLFKRFYDMQQNDPAAVGLTPLTSQYEPQASSLLKRVFSYKDINDNSINKNNQSELPSILAWYNWLNIRCGQSINTGKCNDPAKVFTFTQQERSANTNYAGYYLNKELTPETVSANPTTRDQMEALRKNALKFKELSYRVFKSSESDPWLLSEQRAFAQCVTGHSPCKMTTGDIVPRIDNLPNELKTDITTRKDFSGFAKSLDDLITPDAVVLVPTIVNNKITKWKYMSRAEYLAEAFTESVKTIAASNSTNKHEELKEKYELYIVNPTNEILNPKEAGDLLAKIPKFPEITKPGETEKKALTPATFKDYFNETILTAKMSGGAFQITVDTDGVAVISAIKNLNELYSSDFTGAAEKLQANNNLNDLRKARLKSLLDEIEKSSNYSAKLYGIKTFNSKIVDQELALIKVDSEADAAKWIVRVKEIWRNPNRLVSQKDKFVMPGSDQEVNAQKEILEYYDCFNADKTPKICTEPDYGDTGEQSKRRTGRNALTKLYGILCDNTGESNRRVFAAEVLSKFVNAPTIKTDDDPNVRCTKYKTDYPIDKLSWKQGVYFKSESEVAPSVTP